MKKLLFVTLITVLAFSANAQNKTANSLSYKTAAGIKIWDGAGLSLKTFLNQMLQAFNSGYCSHVFHKKLKLFFK